MEALNKEKFKELWMNDEVETIEKDIDDSWRHGNYVFEVFKYKPDPDGLPIYYSVSYNESSSSDYHGIRDGDFEIERVFPHEKVVRVIEWKSTPAEPKE